MTTSAAPESYVLVPPLFASTPDYDYTLGPEVAEVATMAGLPPDPEQRLILDATFGVRGGKSAARDVGVCAPRQNLKTGSIKQMCLGWIYVLELPLVTWTAHRFDTSQEGFRDMLELIESCPDLDAEVVKVSTGKGSEGLDFTHNRRLRWKARTKGGSRGVTGNRVVLDEAMYLEGAHMAALAPTLRAVPDPQIVYAGSAGFATSHVWRALRDRGRASGDPFLSWHEWASDAEPGGCDLPNCPHVVGTPGCALDDDGRLLRSNSALGRRISMDSLHADRLSMPALNFAVETLGWWEDPANALTAIDAVKWGLSQRDGGLLDEDSRRDGPIAIAFDIDPERTQGSISMFGRRTDGLGHTELVEHGYGVSWLMPRLIDLNRRHEPVMVVVASQAPAAAIAPDLIEAGVPVTFASQSDYARACGAYKDAVDDRSMRHIGQAALTAAVSSVTKKPVGTEGAFIWNRGTGADITAAVSATLARWGYITREEKPRALVPSVHFI